MADPRGRVRVSRVSQVERTAPSSNMIKPVSRAPFTSRAAAKPVVSPNQSRFNQMSPERQQKFQDIQDANGVNFGATRPIYQPGTLGAQNQGVQYAPISRQIPMTPSSAPPAPQQVGQVDTYPPKPIMAPGNPATPEQALENALPAQRSLNQPHAFELDRTNVGPVEPLGSKLGSNPNDRPPGPIPGPALPSPQTAPTGLSPLGFGLSQAVSAAQAANAKVPDVMPSNLSPEDQEAWGRAKAREREQAAQNDVNNTLSGNGTRLMGPNGMPVRAPGGGYLPATAGGSGRPLQVTTGRDGRPVLRPDGSTMVQLGGPVQPATAPQSPEDLAALREKFTNPTMTPEERAAADAATAKHASQIAQDLQNKANAARAKEDPLTNTPVKDPTMDDVWAERQRRMDLQRADSSNPKWMAAREKRKEKHEAARLKLTERAEREYQLRKDRINWRKQMALPPSPETVIAMEAVRRGQFGGPNGLMDNRRDNLMMMGMMNQNQIDRERLNLEREKNQRDAKYGDAQADALKAETEANRQAMERFNSEEAQIERDIQSITSQPQMSPEDADRLRALRKRQAEITDAKRQMGPQGGGAQPAQTVTPPADPNAPLKPNTAPPNKTETLREPSVDNRRIADSYGLPKKQDGSIDTDSMNRQSVSSSLANYTSGDEPSDKDLDKLIPFLREETPDEMNWFEDPTAFYHRKAIADSASLKNKDGSDVSESEARERVRATIKWMRAYNSKSGLGIWRYPKSLEDKLPVVNGYKLVHKKKMLPGWDAYPYEPFEWVKVDK